jgi:hypothetical protein
MKLGMKMSRRAIALRGDFARCLSGLQRLPRRNCERARLALSPVALDLYLFFSTFYQKNIFHRTAPRPAFPPGQR